MKHIMKFNGLLVLVVGLLLLSVQSNGFAQSNMGTQSRSSNTVQSDTARSNAMLMQRMDRIESNLQKKLNLSQDQQSKIRDILNDLRDNIMKADKDISNALNSTQRTKYLSMKDRLFEMHRGTASSGSRGRK